MKQAAIYPATGIGDTILMMIAADSLYSAGYSVTCFHHLADEIKPLFKNIIFKKPLSPNKQNCSPYDLILIQNDNSKRAFDFFELREKNKELNIVFCFPKSSSKKMPQDFLFHYKAPFAMQISQSMEKLLGKPSPQVSNQIVISKDHSFRKYPRRIVIHPTSNDIRKDWTPSQYLTLANILSTNGYEVTFTLSKAEEKTWKKHLLGTLFSLLTTSLKDLASYLYESGYFIGSDSGVGHLASNIGIPTLTIGGNPKNLRLWRPGFSLGKISTLPFNLPNFKGIGLPLRDSIWKKLISPKKVYADFILLQKSFEGENP